MANYHLEVSIISRGHGRSITKAISYISGKKLRDHFNNKTCYSQRTDVLFCKIFQPDKAPLEFYNLQSLCDEIDKAERRYDARTAREFKGSLPNELPASELKRIVTEYIHDNFLSHNLCAVAAIHEGRNENDPSKNNPHVHIIVPTRPVEPGGFSKKKDRESDKRNHINIWRKQWAVVQNRAYERNGLDIRVSHESLKVQGIKNREPTIHLSLSDWQKEKRGERTIAGNKKRAIKERNEEYIRQRQLKQEHELELEFSR